MRRGSRVLNTLDKAKTTMVATLLVLGTLVLAVSQPGQEPPSPIPDWPSDDEWINYTFRGERIRDWEDKPYENDPTHGIANVQPAAVDIASGVDASGGGEENNPGNYTSVQYLYYDGDGDSSACANLDDDWLFLRQRVAGDPRHGGKYVYKSYHWDILLEVDGDIWSEFVVDLNGGDGYFKFGTVGVYYNNTEDYEYDPDNDWVWLQEASKNSNKYTNPRSVDYGTATEDDDQWWVEYRVPVTAFTDLNDNQLLCYDTEFLLFFSTSASMTNPLQKDWMGEYVFGEPANITVVKTVEEDIVAPGDTLHYKIYYNNTGDFNANDVWINDTIPEYTTFHSCYPNYESVNGRTYRWHFTDVEPGNHTVYLNVTVDLNVPDGEILRNVAVLNYTDNKDRPQPGSEDETENPVEGPYMTMAKEADRATADPGDVIHYTITYENTGSGGAYNVTVNDTIPDDATFHSCYPDYESVDGKTYTWVIDKVDGKSSGEILLNVTVDAYTEDGTVLVNDVTLDYVDVNGNTYPQLEAWANVTVTAPLMTVSKTANVTEADPDDEITYTVTYENTGTGNATDVVVRDTIPDYTTFVSSAPGYDSQEGMTYIWNIGTVEGGDSGTITLKVKVNVSTPDTTVLTNYVTLDYDDANGNPYPQESDSVNVSVTAPVMTLSKTADVSTANPGDKITYTISYENTGTGDASNVYVNDTIPFNTKLVSTSKPYTQKIDETYIWKIGDLCGGCKGTLIITVEVKAGTPDKTIMNNTVSLDYSDANGNPYPSLDDYAVVTCTAPVMTVNKEADVSTADPGDKITYNITYENTGTGDASGVVVKDTIPDDVEFVSSSPAYSSVSGKTYTWNIGDVSAGGSGSIILVVKVKAGTTDKKILTNLVTLYYEDVNGNPYPTEGDSVDVTVTAPVMTVSKTASVTTADPGDEINYTLSYENTGTGMASNVKIIDTLPVDVDFVTSYPMYDNASGNVYTWNVGNVSGGTSGEIFVIVKVKAGLGDGTLLRNYVKLQYTDANGDPLPDETDYVDVTVTAPVMTISKTANVATADPGDEVIYTLFYVNTGSGDATDVVVKDTIPDEVDFISSSPNYTSVSGRTYTWNVGDVASGDNGTITITVKVKAFTPDKTVITNNVTLDYDDANGNPRDQESDSASVTITAPVMTIRKVADVSTADPGDKITYTITYTNSGTGNATDVVVEDTIPSDTEYVSSSPVYTSVSGNTYTWEIGDVCAGCNGSIELVVKVKVGTPDKTVLTNDVTLDYDDANGNPQDQESDSVNVTVTAPEMTVRKTADVPTADPSDQITYTIEYKNTGTGDATNVKIVDTIPADTTAVSATPMWNSSSGDDYTWNIGDVSAGGSGNISFVVKVDAGTPDGRLLRNWANLSYADANGNALPDESDYADVTVTAPIMTITKTADVSTADPSDEIEYTLRYDNTGSGEATNVYIVDTIPADVEFVSASPMYTNVSGNTYTWYIASVAGKSGGNITLVVKVKVGTPDETLLRNEVTLDYSDANGNPRPQEKDHVDVLVTAPVFTFSKTADVTEANPGDWINYTITYNNTGTGDATNVWINDTIPAETTLEDTDPAYTSSSGDTYIWDLGTVKAGVGGTITITVSVDAYTEDGSLLRNWARLDYSDANGNPYPQMKDYADVTVTGPEMTVSKVPDVDTADPSDEITYTITYKNTGTGNATDVVIEDTIPTDTEFVSSDPAYTSVSGNTYTWELGDVCGGCEGTIEIVVKVKVGTPDKTLLTNNVTLNYDDANGNPQPEESDSCNVTVTAPVMTISKEADVSTADPSDEITYTIKYENKGTGEATNIWINDTIPADTTFVSANPMYTSVSGDTYTWFFSSISAGGGGTITLVVEVDVGVDDGTILTNNVTLDYADANGNPLPQESDSVRVTVTAPVFTFSKVASVRTADPGDEFNYTIEYQNTGTGNATNVWINDTIPADVIFVSSDPMYTNVSGNTYTWFFSSVAAGSGGTIEIRVKVKAGTPDKTLLRNRATLDYSDANGNPYPQKEDTADVVVTAPVMTIEKVASVSTADPGDYYNYTITYENEGTGEATNIWINDTIPTDTTFIESTPNYYSVSGDTYTWFFSSVGAGTKGEIHIKVQVDVGTPDGTLLRNNVTLDYSDANGNPYKQLSDYADVWVTAPVMNLTKEADVTTADPSDEITYTVTFENSGAGNATKVYINDTIPDDVDFVSSTPNYTSVSGKTYTWYWVVVGPNKTVTITIVVRVKAYTPDKTLLHNKATLDYCDDNGNPYDTEIALADVKVTAPVMEFSKVASVTTADPGDQFTYTITYKNNGTGDATGVKIADTIPADVEFVSSSPAYSSVSGNTYTWDIGNLSAGSGGTIVITVKVKVGTPDQRLLRNEAVLYYADANGNEYTPMEDYADVRVTAPVMTFSKDMNVTKADPGDQFTYTITYKNNGTGVATNVKITDTIPADVNFVSSSPPYTSVSGNTYTWDIGTLNPGQGGTITIIVEVKVRTPDRTLLRNEATLYYADANGNDYTPMTDTADVTVTAPVMEFSKTVGVTTADPGDQFTYTITVENTGTGNACCVWVNDTIPADVIFVSSNPSYTSVSGNTYTWYLGWVNSLDKVTITITVKVKVGTPDRTLLRNIATLDYSDANENPYDRMEDSADVRVTAPVMEFSKTVDVRTADPGDQFNYTITYKNIGTGNATNVKITDTIPADVDFVSSSPPYSSVSGLTYTWDIGDVNSGDGGTITITVKVKVGTPDQRLLRNEAVLYYADANGNDYTPMEDYADVKVTAPVMTFSKVADVRTADPSDLITYTLTYQNVGTGDATKVMVSDTIPDDVEYVSSSPTYTLRIGNTFVWNIGNLAAGDGDSITLTVKVKPYTPDKTLLNNTAIFYYADANENDYTPMEDYALVKVTAPVLRLIKSADARTADPGDEVVYTIYYVNLGSGVATDVVVQDTIPPDTIFVSSSPLYNSVSGNTYTWNIGTLNPGEDGYITITVKVKPYTPDRTLLRNNVTLDYDDANGNPYPQLDDYADVWVTAPVMEFSKTVDNRTADPGDQLIYTITYKNIGTGVATNVKITDTIPADVNFVSSSPPYTSVSGNTYTWDIGTLNPGQGGTITIIVEVKVGTPDKTPLRNVAILYYADANGNEYAPMRDYADVMVTAPVMRFSKVADVSRADPGDEIVYTLRYENTGTGWASMVVIVDTIPADTVFVSSSPWYDGSSGDEYTWRIGDVAPGGSGTITITVKVEVGTPDKTLLRNRATLDYSDANGNFIDQLSDHADVIVTAPVLHLIKRASVSKADPGDPITYTIRYWNSGTGWATLVEIVDTIPADVTFVSSNPRYTSQSGNDYVWTIGDLAPGGSGTITIEVVVNVGVPDRTLLRNNVTLEYADANGNYYRPLRDYADVVVTAPVMTLEKFAGSANISAYVIVDFRLRVAGEKWHDVVLTLYDGNESTAVASVTRYPGSPDDQSVTIYDVKIDILGDYSAIIEYTPLDDAINGQIWGADPAWLILTFEEGKSVRLKHTFNVRHNETWIWVIDDFRPYLKGAPIIYEATIPYTIVYENTGTGDATDVVITDTFPAGSIILDSNPPYDTCNNSVCIWYIGDVLAGEKGYIFVNITYIFDEDSTVVTNEVTLDYSDANGNYIEQLYAFANSTLMMPGSHSIPPAGSGDCDPGTGTCIPPNAIISSPSSGSYYWVGDTIGFDGSTSSDDMEIVSYLWSFGDGTTSTQIMPSHTFAMPGTYAVRLTVTDSDGVTSSDYVLVFVGSKTLSAVIELPTEEIIFEGTVVGFSGMAAYHGFEGPFYCHWDFGDGTSSPDCTTSHYFGDDGIFTISFSVFDENGNEASETIEITVLNVKPTVSVLRNVHGLEGYPVYFTAYATDPGDDELSFVWDLGDGTTVTGTDFYHTYVDNGLYVVTLTVTDGDGGTVVKVIIVHIKNLPPKANAGEVRFAHVDEPVSFSGSVSDIGALDSFKIVWNMGDGTTVEGELNPVHTYRASGVYTVRLTITDNDGAKTVSVTKAYVTQSLDTVLDPPTHWDDTTTPIVDEEDRPVSEDAPLPLAAIVLMIMNIIALAAGSYVWFRFKA